MLDTDDEICKCCLENDSDSQDLEAVSIPLMLYSDSTHPANFGNASAWPVYMFFGSQSKYVRAMPTFSACHHIAYLPSVRNIEYFYFIIWRFHKLPDKIQDFYQEWYKTTAMAATLTHCKRELMHVIFSLLINDRFVDAYQHGLVLNCGDGHRRRLFPRILMYLADYISKTSSALKICLKCLKMPFLPWNPWFKGFKAKKDFKRFKSWIFRCLISFLHPKNGK